MPCGISAIDELLHGGLPTGVLIEFVGAESSGRTTMALAYMAAMNRAGAVCAWIDVADSLDPESVAACGVDLERLLWVRCGVDKQTTSSMPPEDRHRAPSPTPFSIQQARHIGGGSPHPRSEGRDMPQAVSVLLAAHGLNDKHTRLRKRAVGTPGMPNRPLSHRSEDREEQVNSDRLPPRRGDALAIGPRCTEPQPRRVASMSSGEHFSSVAADVFRAGKFARKSWPLLDQALRSADVLLHGGGFSIIVLDLGSTPPEVAWRIPLATWFRFRAACERTRISLILLTQHSCARSSAELVVRLKSGGMEAESRVMTGIRYQAETKRSRSRESEARVVSIRKPPQSESSGQWTAWAQAK